MITEPVIEEISVMFKVNGKYFHKHLDPKNPEAWLKSMVDYAIDNYESAPKPRRHDNHHGARMED